MELLFETRSSEFLREAYYGTISQEETGETAGGILGALRELVDGCLSYFS